MYPDVHRFDHFIKGKSAATQWVKQQSADASPLSH